MTALVNENPEIFNAPQNFARPLEVQRNEADEDMRDPIDALEVYQMLKDIKDPEHPNTLEQLRVMEPGNISVNEEKSTLSVFFTPTVPHCSMTALIGLCIREQLKRSLPQRFKVEVRVTPGSHEQEAAVNKQLNDKERVAAAMEMKGLMNAVSQCIDA